MKTAQKILLKARAVEIANDACLNIFSRGGLFCHQSHLLNLFVVTLLFCISLRQILWLYLYRSKQRKPRCFFYMTMIARKVTINLKDIQQSPYCIILYNQRKMRMLK